MHARTIPETGRAFSAPSGTEDLLEPWSLRRVELKARLLTCLRRHGYALVSTPPFEYADVIERSLPDHRSAEVVRFVEADSGRVVLLRPDITPQVARIASTHLRAHPAPLRLCYQGTVVRRDKRRARRSQQSSQVGVECIGLPGLDGDVEVLRLLGDACRAAGLTHYRVEIGRVDLGRALLAPVPAPWRAQAAAALLRKDHGLLQQVLTESQTTGPEAAALLALLEAYGDAACLTALRQGLPQHRTVQACLDAVEALLDRLQDAHPTATLGVDLGELRGHAYYTSTHFTLFADG
ncbi:MAG: ATP phosphoribosyltransferase regulatory subunit, partial [Polyangiales bacterium]